MHCGMKSACAGVSLQSSAAGQPLRARQAGTRTQKAPGAVQNHADGNARVPLSVAAAAGWQRWRHHPDATRPQAVWQQRHRRARRAALRALQVEAPSEALSVEAAWALLEDFTQREARGLAQPLLDSPEKRRRLRDALLVAAAAPYAAAGWNPEAAASSSAVPEVLLGVVASDVRLAVRSLRDYCQALGLPFQMPESRVPGVAAAPALVGPVYIKHNAATGLCYATKYDGRDRGVLVQLGQRQLGHLPLGLHDEGMARPPPAALG